MDGLTDEQTDGRTGGWTDGRTDVHTDGPTHGRADGRTDRQAVCLLATAKSLSVEVVTQNCNLLTLRFSRQKIVKTESTLFCFVFLNIRGQSLCIIFREGSLPTLSAYIFFQETLKADPVTKP